MAGHHIVHDSDKVLAWQDLEEAVHIYWWIGIGSDHGYSSSQLGYNDQQKTDQCQLKIMIAIGMRFLIPNIATLRL